MNEKNRSWEHRLSNRPDDLTIDFVESISYDKRLAKYDIVGSIAHAKMLADRKFITADEFRQIQEALFEIGEQIDNNKFDFDKKLEDIHMAVENALIKKIGNIGRKLHTARSRNDQVATDVRLWIRDGIDTLKQKLSIIQKAFMNLASKHIKDIMPAYTHMQRAQPIVIASYLLSFVEQFDRDSQRLSNCLAILNVSPLGSGAVAGSTLAIDRKSTASELGFSEIMYNTIDAVSDRDFCAEFIFDCALIAAHLSKLAEDWIIYCSNEFDFIRINDSFCTSSSMMPQKRNPDLLELIRAKTASVYGSLMAMLTILKAQPSGYNRDLQEDKIHVFSAFDTVCACLEVAAAIVSNTTFNIEKIKSNIDEGFLDATALAEYLVSKEVPFRTAHGIVGQIVSFAEKQGTHLSKISLEDFKKLAPVIQEDVYQCLGAENVVAKYVSEGACGPEQAKKQVDYWKKRLAGK